MDRDQAIAWLRSDFGLVEEQETSYEDLESAARAAHEYVARREGSLR